MTTARKLLAFILVLVILMGTMTVYAVESDSYTSELPVTVNGAVAGTDGYLGDVTVYSESEAAAAGVPEGYVGHVIRVAPSAETGALAAYPTCDFDFSSQNIPISSIESITFRVYFYSGDKAIRLKTPYTSESWVMNVTPSEFGAWTEVTLDVNGTNFNSGCSMSDLANSDGCLGQLALIGRLSSSKEKCYYIDSITIKYKEGVSDDTTPPVITYNGPTELELKEGESFSLDGISAFDEYDNASAAITYEWSAGAVNSLGNLQVGTHIFTVIATDRSGNASSISVTVSVAANTAVINLDSIPYTEYISGVSIYNGTVTDLTPEEASSAGVPGGYTGNVLKVTSMTSTNARFGMTFDPESLRIPINLIESITFRLYMKEDDNAIRISNMGESNWIVLAKATKNEWMEYSITSSGSGFTSTWRMGDLADENGYLGVFGIGTNYRFEDGEEVDYTFYIDSIVIQLKEDDKVGPVLNYEGETDIITTAGKPFVPGITAYHALEERYVPLDYEWSEGALDADGNMVEGEHTCVVSATDYYGNISAITLNVTVGPPDVKAPEIQFEASEIYVPVGTFYRMAIACVDDYDKVDLAEEWSDGAIDIGGRLSKGIHTLTLTATDLSGNKTVRVVTVHVVDGDYTVGQLIECGKK